VDGEKVLKVIRQMYDVALGEYIPESVIRFWSRFIEEEENHGNNG